jgi:hypothetical protein
MKKLLLLAGLYCLQPTLHAASFTSSVKHDKTPISANDRAQANFKENYAWVENATWTNAPDQSINCVFQQGKTANRVFYDKRGYWQFTLISYQPSVLAKKVKELVLDNFHGYKITYVNEIRSDSEVPVYMINIEDGNNIKVIRVIGDDIEVTQDIIKGT